MSRTIRRCAIYTRKSTEEGLAQGFNSLDAQREACTAYVKSQASEGWRAIPTRYDDGGVSGATLERPGLRRLLAEIEAGKVHVVVVYKIDRLTRSLADFAQMVALFDRHEVSFVSVTQAFNTTSSMGRLTLNVLLSFAQFEREVTAERIRDKIAASKAKGMWMGGTLPLGYDLPDPESRTLEVNAAEAETVRLIFETYLALGSVHALERWLAERDIRSKQRITRSGRRLGGHRFSRGALFHLLRNRLYLGEIVHKGVCHPGRHAAILDASLFDAVQEKLDAQRRRERAARDGIGRAPLTGRVFDAEGHPMSPTVSHGRGGRCYRYYVSAPLQQGRQIRAVDGAIRRISAPALEARLTEVLRRLAPHRSDEPLDLPQRVEIRAEAMQLTLAAEHLDTTEPRLAEGEELASHPADPARLRLTLPLGIGRSGKTLIQRSHAALPRPDPGLVKALRAAHAMLSRGTDGLPVLDTAPRSPYRRRLLRMAFLAPDLQRAILSGRQPAGLTLKRLIRSPLPLSWAEQIRLFRSG